MLCSNVANKINHLCKKKVSLLYKVAIIENYKLIPNLKQYKKQRKKEDMLGKKRKICKNNEKT